MPSPFERIPRTGFVRDGIRFLVAAGANAVLSLAVYQLLLFWTTPWAAYLGSWACSLVFVVTVYPDKVFLQGRTGPAARLGITVSYVVVLLVGLVALEALTRLGVAPRLAILLVMAITTITNFTVSRLLLRR